MAIVSMLLVVFALVWVQRIIYRKLWDKRLDLKINFSAKEAYEGETLYLTEELTNAKVLPMPWVTAKFQTSKHLLFENRGNARVSDDYYQNDMFSVMMYQKISRKLYFRCAKRGFYRISGIYLTSGNIFISEKFVKYIPSDAGLTVYPGTISTQEFDVTYQKIYGAVLARRFINPDPFEFRGIRDYEPNDPLKSVNFKASARANKLMVNIHGYTSSQNLVVVVNFQEYSSWPDLELYETAIRLAASLAGRFIDDGMNVGILTNGRDITTGETVEVKGGTGGGHLVRILEAFARIDLSKPAEPIAPVIEENASEENAYVIVSTYHEEDIVKAYESLIDEGFDVHWIVPVYKDMKTQLPEHEHITRWDVAYDV